MQRNTLFSYLASKWPVKASQGAIARRFLLPSGRPRPWLIWLAGVYLVYCLVSGLVLPPLLKPFLEQELAHALHAPCSIKTLAYNPFTLTLKAKDVHISYPEGGDFLALEELEVSPGLSSVFHLTPVVSRLIITRPSLFVSMSHEGVFSLEQFAAASAASQEKESTAEKDKKSDEAIFPLIVSNFEVRGGSIDFFDGMHNVHHTVRDLHLLVPFTSTLVKDKKHAMHPSMNATVNDEFIAVSSVTRPFADDMRTELRLRFGELDLEQFKPYLSYYTKLSLDKGTLATEVSLVFTRQGNGFDLGVLGSLYVNDFALSVPEEGQVLSMDYGLLDIGRVSLLKEQLIIDDLQLVHPRVSLAREKDGSLNWQRYFIPPPKPLPPQQPLPATATDKAPQSSNGTLVSPPPGAAQTVLATPAPPASAPQSNLEPEEGPQADEPSQTPLHQSETAPALPKGNGTATSLAQTSAAGQPLLPQNATSSSLPQEKTAQMPLHQSNQTSALDAPFASHQNPTSPYKDGQKQLLPQAAGKANATLPSALPEHELRTGQLLTLLDSIPLVAIKKVSVVDAHIVWKDAIVMTGPAKEYGPINLEALDFSTEGKGRGSFVFTVGKKYADTPRQNSTPFSEHPATLSANGTLQSTIAHNSTAPTSHNSTASVLHNATLPVSQNSTAPGPKNATAGPFAETAVSVPPTASNTAPTTNATVVQDVQGEKAPKTQSIPEGTMLFMPEKNFGIPLTNSTLRVSNNSSLASEEASMHQPEQDHFQQIFLPKGGLVLGGYARLFPLQLDTIAAFDRFSLSDAAPYAKAAGIELKQAFLDSQIHLYAEETPKGNIIISTRKGSVTLQDISANMPLEGGKAALKASVSVAGITFDKEKNTLALDSIDVFSPHLQLALDAPKTTAPSGKSDSSQSKAVTEPPSAPHGRQHKDARPLTVAVESFVLHKGQVDVTNAMNTGANLSLTGIEGKVKSISTSKGDPFSFTVRGAWNKSGHLSIEGQGTFDPIHMTASGALTSIPLASLTPWLHRVAVFDTIEGVASSTFTLAVTPLEKKSSSPSGSAPASENKITLTGTASLENFSMKIAKQEVVGLRRLDIRGMRLDSGSGSYDIRSVAITGPRIHFALFADGMNTISRTLDVTGEAAIAARRTMKRSGTAALEKAVEEAAATETARQVKNPSEREKAREAAIHSKPILPAGVRLTLGQLIVSNGSLRFRDETMPQKGIISFSDIDLRVDSLSSALGATASYALTARTEGGKLTAKGKGRPLYTPIHGDLVLTLDGMDMVPLSPYAEKFIAYPIESGSLSLNIDVKTEGKLLEAKNTIILKHLELGHQIKTPGAPDLPVKLGLSVLSDSSGTVTLDVPITGHLDDPNLRTGGVVIQAFGNILFKLAASPFSLLGSVLGIGSDEPSLQYITFAPGDDRLTEKSISIIKDVVKLLAKRPKIQLVLTGVVDEAETQSLAAAYIHKGLQQLKWEDLSRREREATLPTDVPVGPEVNAEEYEKLLFDFYAAQPFDKPKTLGFTKKQTVPFMIEMIEKNVPTTEDALLELAQRRAEAVKDALVTAAPELASRIAVEPSAKIRTSGAGKAPLARVEFGIK